MSHEELPTPREEIERKAIDTLVQALELHEMGRIDSGRVGVIARAVWDTTAGVVSRDAMERISRVIEEHPLRPIVRTFLGVEGTVQLRWAPEKPGLAVVRYHPITLERTGQLIGGKDLDGHERDQKINQVAQALIGKGFIEVK